MKITDVSISSMGIGKLFKEDNTAPINSMDFYKDGTLLVTASDDESIHFKKYGVDLIRFTHHNNAILCASKNAWDESLRYLSLHDNKYIRYFKGHRNRVVSLSMSPKEDTFMSGSLDDTIRLWDLRTSTCQGIMRRNNRPAVSYDPEGLILATAVSANTIKLFDARNYDRGPFMSFVIQYNNPVEWTSMKFSNDGKYILLTTTENTIFLIDSFYGQTVQTFTSFTNDNASVMEASFTPDTQYVIAGSEDGTIHVWRTLTGEEVAVWGGHTSKVGCVQWNPKMMMAASACSTLSFWIPSTLE
ncbi:hypothetical protein PPL_03866 [Heterostelium album PN500]|uniref:Uncharacterized protein n=1 Tax=Heterostelium pallidum (strain ATCC 26659 / Pp 5 / PN500) TaxID=670386 RepID=D3B5D0_HETP5|nr:hypothetical protein PPL_03866 [Heterostelium album PN500]EFA83078.1 hypothetical protein PPL_03866 [Heterostelium album PN500]|eukprot:XP_020435195.1 hypothetical protein PPL_03866 [Heterostelium album PN500]